MRQWRQAMAIARMQRLGRAHERAQSIIGQRVAVTHRVTAVMSSHLAGLGRVDGFRKVASGGIPKSVFL